MIYNNILLSFLSHLGLIVGDEILVINGKVVSELDMVYVETLLAESEFVCMTIRSCRVERPQNTTALMEHADVYIENMMCPPPPTQSRISDKAIGDLIVPAPNWGEYLMMLEEELVENMDKYCPKIYNGFSLDCMILFDLWSTVSLD